MNLEEYRASEREKKRTEDLLRLLSVGGNIALDIGARDGHFSKLLADRFDKVIALDLTPPSINDKRIQCVAGNLLNLDFPDQSFDLVLCAEVLEHIPSDALEQACRELIRVTKRHLLVGVPYMQDLRLHRTTCPACRTINPPWGHVNSFDESRLRKLFADLVEVEVSQVGENREVTNDLSAMLMNFSGNPFGTYGQDEPCINCGTKLTPPPKRNAIQRLATRTAHWLTRIQQHITPPHANWIHLLFRRS